MHELTHPVELRDQELDLVAAGSGGRPPHNGGDKCCGGDNQTGLVNVETGNINVLNNIAVLSLAHQGVFN
jgi:hypothetical protein